MAKIVALLESMWGWGGYNEPGAEAPRFFRINPDNHSGRRLYSLVGSHDLMVTNCCRYVQENANRHGEPDLEWVKENLLEVRSEMQLLLVCGVVARQTYVQMMQANWKFEDGFPTWSACYIDHPAARRWSKEKITQTRLHIERLLCP